jgi:hypothetical protein
VYRFYFSRPMNFGSRAIYIGVGSGAHCPLN